MFRRLALLAVGGALAVGAQPNLQTVIEKVRSEYRSADAMRVMRDVYANDRYFTFPRFHATAEYLKTRMQQAGLTGVEIVEVPADGVTQAGYWTMPLAWDVKRARLEILDDRVPAASMRHPKLLQPMPTSETCNDPSFRYSISGHCNRFCLCLLLTLARCGR